MKSRNSDWLENLTRAQRYLLNACMAPTKAEQEQWVQAWETTVDIQDLDFGSSRLVPYFFHKNQKAGIISRHDNRLKIIYKHWWLRTQHITDLLQKVNVAFLKAGIESVIIKGASIRSYYERLELRTMSDFDLLIHPGKLQEALRILRQLDFVQDEDTTICLKEIPRLMLDFTHGIPCIYRINQTPVDLHWRIGSLCTKQFTEKLWTNLDDYPYLQGAKQPKLEYIVFLILIHAAMNRNEHNLNWILDIHAINEHQGLDYWPAVQELAREEKKEAVLDYACSILLKFGIFAPHPRQAVHPPRLTPINEEMRKQLSLIRLGYTKIINLYYHVYYRYPNANAFEILYQGIRRTALFVYLTKRGKSYLG